MATKRTKSARAAAKVRNDAMRQSARLVAAAKVRQAAEAAQKAADDRFTVLLHNYVERREVK